MKIIDLIGLLNLLSLFIIGNLSYEFKLNIILSYKILWNLWILIRLTGKISIVCRIKNLG